MFIKIIFSILSAFSQNLNQYLASRFCYAIFIGLNGPPAVSQVTEMTPAKYRGTVNTFFVGIGFVVGEALAAGVAILTIDDNNKKGDTKDESWRWMLGFMTIPVALAWISTYCTLDESPRVLMIRGRFEEGYEVLKKMARVSGREKVCEKLDRPEIKHQIRENMLKTIMELTNQ